MIDMALSNVLYELIDKSIPVLNPPPHYYYAPPPNPGGLCEGGS